MYFICFLVLASCRKDKPIAIAGSSEIRPKQANSFTTLDYDGLEAVLENTTAGITVVNFWATWCKPCIKELPYFEEVRSKYTDDELTIILVSLDFPDELERLENFIKKRGLKSEVILLDDPDANSWINKVDKSWSGAIPATIIFNKNKRNFYERSFTFQELEQEINQFKL